MHDVQSVFHHNKCFGKIIAKEFTTPILSFIIKNKNIFLVTDHLQFTELYHNMNVVNKLGSSKME